MHPAQEPQMASYMRHHVCLVQELGLLWIVESLVTSGLYGMIFLLTRKWYNFFIIILKHLSLIFSHALNNNSI